MAQESMKDTGRGRRVEMSTRPCRGTEWRSSMVIQDTSAAPTRVDAGESRPAPMQRHRRTARQVSPSTISRTPTPSTTTSRSFLNAASRIPPR